MKIDIFKDLDKTIGGAFKNVETERFLNELSNKLKNMEDKFTIDRFENDIAVCENRKTGEIIEIEKSKLPLNIKEGTIIKKVNNEFIEDIEENEKTAERIKNKMDNLWN